MVVQGEDDLFGVLEVLDRGVGGEEMVPNMAVAPPERRECAPMSSRENQSLAAPTQRVSALMTEIMFEVLTERSP